MGDCPLPEGSSHTWEVSWLCPCPAEPDWRRRRAENDGVPRHLSWLFEGGCWRMRPMPGSPQRSPSLPQPLQGRGATRAPSWQPGAGDSAARGCGASPPSLLLRPHLLQASSPSSALLRGTPQSPPRSEALTAAGVARRAELRPTVRGSGTERKGQDLSSVWGWGGCPTSQKVRGPASQIRSP